MRDDHQGSDYKFIKRYIPSLAHLEQNIVDTMSSFLSVPHEQAFLCKPQMRANSEKMYLKLVIYQKGDGLRLRYNKNKQKTSFKCFRTLI